MSGATVDDDPTANAGEDATANAGDLAGRHVMFLSVLYKKALLLVRYPVNTGAQLVTIYLFFAVIFFGGKAAAKSMGTGGRALAPTLEGLIVGWFLWTMAIGAYFSLSENVTQEAQWGTLEQLYMSPYGFGSVMASMVVANLLESFLWGGVMLALMLLTTAQTLAVDVVTIVPVSLLALMSVVGLGFVFAGLALVYKRVSSVSQIMQFVIVGLIAAPVAEVPALRYLPLVQGSAMLQRAMRHGVRLWAFPVTDLALLVATAVAYSLAGYAFFRYCARVARKRGVMGHY